MVKKLSVKQRKLTKAYIETGNEAEAGRIAGYGTRQAAHKALRRPYVKKTIIQLLDKVGLTDNKIARKVADLVEATKPISCNIYLDKDGKMKEADGKSMDFIDVPDNTTQLNAIKFAAELKHHIKSNNHSSVGDIHFHFTIEERKTKLDWLSNFATSRQNN